MSEAGQAQRDDPRTLDTVMVGVGGTLLVLAIIIALEALHHRTANAEQLRKEIAPSAELSRVRAEQLERLGGYRWVDEANGIVAIPIERAMQLVVEESRE